MCQNRWHYACGAEHNRRWSGWGMTGTARIHCLAISRGLLLLIEVLLLDALKSVFVWACFLPSSTAGHQPRSRSTRSQ